MEVMNIKELSEYLKISCSTIRRLIQNKEIPFYKVSAQYFFNKNSINEWIMNQEYNNFGKERVNWKKWT